MTSFWMDRPALIGRQWAHDLILHLHKPATWPRPSLENLDADERSLADRMLAAHRLDDGDVDPEFTSLAEVLEEQTLAFEQEWQR